MRFCKKCDDLFEQEKKYQSVCNECHLKIRKEATRKQKETSKLKRMKKEEKLK